MYATRQRLSTAKLGRARFRRLWGVLTALAFVVGTAAAVPAGAADEADLVLIHGISPDDVGFDVLVDVLVDGQCVVAELEFADVTFGLDFAPGSHQLTVAMSDGSCGGAVLIDTSVLLVADEDTTSVIHLDENDDASLTTYTDNTTGLGRNRGRVVFANLSGASSLDMTVSRSGRSEPAVPFSAVRQNTQATAETWIGTHDFHVAVAGQAAFYEGTIELDQNASVALYGVGQSPDTFTVIQNRRRTGEDPGLNGVFVTVANTYTEDGLDGERFPYGNATARRVGPGIEVRAAAAGFTYSVDVDGQGISMVWDTDPEIDDVEGIQEDGFFDIYTFTFAEPVLAGMTATAVATAALVPEVEIVSDTELVVTTGPGTEIGDAFDARIVLGRSGAVGATMSVQPRYGLDGVFVTVSNLVQAEDGGEEIPFGNRTAARVGGGPEINPAQSGFDYLIDLDASSVSFVWDQTNPFLDFREGAMLPGTADIYVLSFAEPVLADLRAEVDEASSLVPYVEVISDRELVVIVGDGAVVGDGFDAVINLVD